MEKLVTVVKPVPKDKPVHLDPLDQLVHEEKLDPPDQVERLDDLDLLDPLDQPDQLEHVVNLELLDPLELTVAQVCCCIVFAFPIYIK